jgi:hypothetical protein
MPYKNKEDANASARRRWKENPEARMKQRAATKKWQDENKEHWNDYRNKWMKSDRDANMEVSRARELVREMKKYGTTVEWYRDKLIAQNGLCEMCGHLSHHHGTLQRLQVDHDHACCDIKTKSCGKCLRGLLCFECNIRLAPLEALLRDFPSDQAEIYLRNTSVEGSWTKKALRYLKHYSEESVKRYVAGIPTLETHPSYTIVRYPPQGETQENQ